MCGIFGFLATGVRGQVDLDRLYCGIRHRGPDAAQVFVLSDIDGTPSHGPMQGKVSAALILGQVRLSIIDVSEAGTQPFESGDGRYILSYNGEIYNYIELRGELERAGWTFDTHTDTEVLLKSWMHWGQECLKRFVGMFSFLLLDRHKGRIFAVRDPFGIKPLYFHQSDQGFVFCSDYMALQPFLSPSEVQLRGRETTFYLRYGVTQNGTNTLIDSVQRVGLGEVLEISLDHGEIIDRHSYCDFVDFEPQDWEFEDARQAIRDAFMESVELHMRADVPYAATLSGGIDSSAIVCAMHAVSDAPIHTFSFHAETKEISETRWIDIVNKHIGAQAHPIRPKTIDFETDLEKLLRHQGEPFGSLSIYASYKVQQEIAEAGFKVVLSGQGADEMFAGYTHYLGDYATGLLRKGRHRELAAWLQVVPQQIDGISTKTIVAQIAERLLGPTAINSLRTLGRRPNFQPWIRTSATYGHVAALTQFKQRSTHPSHLRGALMHSLTQGPLADLLRYEDRNAMAHSIENRVPFLTPKLARLSLSMPDHFLISRKGVTKHIFREAMRGIVPDEILDRRDKIGFAPDNATWLDPTAIRARVKAQWTAEADRFIDRGLFEEKLGTVNLKNGREADAVWRTVNLISFVRIMQERART